MKKCFVLMLALSAGLFSFSQSSTSYAKEIEQWTVGRYASLRDTESGWLNLTGLYWLKQGTNSFGTDAKNSIVYPKGSIVPFAGTLELNGTTVTLKAQKGVALKANNQPISSGVIFSVDTANNPVLSYGTLHWTIIKREDKIGIRLRDDNSPVLTHFKGIERFETDAAWRLTAILKEPLFPTTIPVKNVLGQTVNMKLMGKLIFTINHTIYSLDAVEEGEELFVIFGDATNAKTTYGAGRFLYTNKPDASGKTVIDFNKAFNPPCAFTAFATCPLPPEQNVLPVAITAGEKNFGQH